MKVVTDFIKGNPVVVASVLVVLAALAFLLLFVHSGGQQFVQDVEKRRQDMSKIEGLMRTSLTIPGEKPDDPPRQITAVPNLATITKLEEVYAEMQQQYDKVTKRAIEYNQKGHVPMMDGLFPEPTTASTFTAKKEYREALQVMLSRPTSLDADAPRLNAGKPPAEKDFLDEVQKVEDKLLASLFTRKTIQELSVDDQKRLAGMKTEKALDMVQDVARRIYIYAETDPTSEDYPFDVGLWSAPGPAPTMAEVFEGQMNLWIQQDIVRAIQLANSPIVDGVPIRDFNVKIAPVKRLMKIKVKEGYVGINTKGIVNTFAETTSSVGRDSVGGPRGDRFASENRVREQDFLAQENVQTTFRDEIAAYSKNPNQRLPEMFQIVPSGRVSNAIYDVRHVTLDVIVDFKQMPKLFEAIGKVNFMTVLNVHVTDVDEYEALQKRFAYGDSDCVRVQMLIETIWLRAWTKKYMPDSVRESLGIAKDDPAAPGEATDPSGASATPGTP